MQNLAEMSGRMADFLYPLTTVQPKLMGGLRTRRDPEFNKIDRGLLTAMTIG